MIYFILFFLSIILTYAIRSYAIKKAIIDIPNERSSHTIPVPRGGGVAIIMVFYIGLIYFSPMLDTRLVYALLSALPIAMVSLLDDIFTLSSKIRLIVQSISAILALYFLGGIESIDFTFFELHGWWLNIFAFFTILWLTNLYNFLDGIDGYAGIEAITIGIGLLLFFHNPLGGVIIASCLGFLLFNWHKASIFMGDVGSATLGFLFSVFIFYDTSNGNIYIWLVLLSLFWFDASLTLIRRYLNKEKLTQAHKKHAYQRLVQSGWSHAQVSLFALLFNLGFIAILYFINDKWFIALVNIVILFLLMKYIDHKKSFS